MLSNIPILKLVKQDLLKAPGKLRTRGKLNAQSTLILGPPIIQNVKKITSARQEISLTAHCHANGVYLVGKQLVNTSLYGDVDKEEI